MLRFRRCLISPVTTAAPLSFRASNDMPQTRTFMVWDVLAIAILQASVIICGLLMAQSTDNRAGFLGPLPWSGGILADFGWVALVIPLSWLWWILHVRRNRNAPPKSDTPAFLFGR